MKILLTVHQFFPEFKAGTEVLTLSVARELLWRGHDVRVYTGHPSEKSLPEEKRFDEYEFEGIHTYRFHYASVPMAGQTSMIEVSYDNHLAASHFEKILQSFKPDVVHFFHLNRLGSRLIDKTSQFGVSAFMTVTDFWPICPIGQLLLPDGKLCKGPNSSAGNCVKHFAQNRQAHIVAKLMPTILINFLTRIAGSAFMPAYPTFTEVKAISMRLGTNISRLNRLRKIVAPNKMMRDVLIANGVDPRLIVEMTYGIDIIESISRPAIRKPRRPFRIGFIGTLAHHKGCHVLIEAFKALPRDRAILKIYGELKDFPEYSNELRLRAEENAGIEFCGIFPNLKIPEVLADLDVLVVPSVWQENTPLVIYSAQAALCPVVGSDVQGISEVIINEENGLLFESGNAIALATQLLRLIDEEGLIARLSSNAKQPKSISTYVDELLKVWEVI